LVISLTTILVEHVRKLLQIISILRGILLFLLSGQAELCPKPVLGCSSDFQVFPTDVQPTDDLVQCISVLISIRVVSNVSVEVVLKTFANISRYTSIGRSSILSDGTEQTWIVSTEVSFIGVGDLLDGIGIACSEKVIHLRIEVLAIEGLSSAMAAFLEEEAYLRLVCVDFLL
jgi:hypothetical protein